MDSNLHELFSSNGIPDEIRTSVETAGWITLRLFRKLFASDDEAKEFSPRKFKFENRPDAEIVAAKFAIA